MHELRAQLDGHRPVGVALLQDASPQPIASLEQIDAPACPRESPRSHQARDPATDDEDPSLRHVRDYTQAIATPARVGPLHGHDAGAGPNPGGARSRGENASPGRRWRSRFRAESPVSQARSAVLACNGRSPPLVHFGRNGRVANSSTRSASPIWVMNRPVKVLNRMLPVEAAVVLEGRLIQL